MLFTLLACQSPPRVDARPEAALCDPSTERSPLVARACDGPDAPAAVRALATAPIEAYLPVLVEHLDDVDVRRAVASLGSHDARRALAAWRPAAPGPATSAGGRWRRIEQLPDLEGAAYRDAVEMLVAADWTLQRAPDDLVDQARVRSDDPAAWPLLAQAGRFEPLLEALANPASPTGLEVALGGRIPPSPEVDAAIREALGDAPLQRLLALDPAATDPLTITAWLPADADRCELFGELARSGTRVDPGWALDALSACGEVPPPSWLLDPQVYCAYLPSRPDDTLLRSRLLGSEGRYRYDGRLEWVLVSCVDDPLILALALQRLAKVIPPRGLLPVLQGLAGHPDPWVRRGVADVVAARWPDVALPILRDQLRDVANRRHALELLGFLDHPDRVQELLRVGNDPEMAWAFERVSVLLDAR